MLVGIVRHVGKFQDGYFLLLHPSDNAHCKAAVDAYGECLACPDTFATLTLEALITEIKKYTDGRWVQKVYDRYLRFDKEDALLQPSPSEVTSA